MPRLRAMTPVRIEFGVHLAEPSDVKAPATGAALRLTDE